MLAYAPFCGTVWVKAKVPWASAFGPNLYGCPAAAFAGFSRWFYIAFLRQWEGGRAGLVEVVCAADKSFFCFLRVLND